MVFSNVPKYFKSLMPVATLVVIGVAAALPGSAITIANETFNFVGTCGDCTGFGDATLVLSGTYTLGSPITVSNFVSFAYAGTNLLPAFTINSSSPGLFVSGNLPNTLPGTANLTIDGGTEGFNSNISGAWTAGALADHGVSSNWSVPATSTPEPATTGSLGLVLAALILLVRRRGLAA
jgi:hypothetical protein